MLMNAINQLLQEPVDHTELVQPIVKVPVSQQAANASGFEQSAMQARRLRRARRMTDTGRSGRIGWTLRTW